MVDNQSKDITLAVDAKDVSVNFGGRKSVRVLNGVNISVGKGKIYGLLGPSGCGKTTLLRCIIGCMKPKEGEIKVFGKCPGERNLLIPGRGVGYMPQELALYQEMTVDETLTYFGCLYQMDRLYLAERISFLVKFLDIPDKRRMIKKLSGGQQRRVSFAVAIIHQPPLLILDEPTVGVDPLLRKSIWGHLASLAAEYRTTIIITTHYVEEAIRADIVGLMRNGRLLVESNPRVLLRKFHLSSLEDVFLKLCQNDVENTEVHSDEKTRIEVISEVKNPASEETREPIWLIRKVPKRRTGKLQNGDREKIINRYSSTNEGIHEKGERMSSRQLKWRESWNRFCTIIKKDFIRLKRSISALIFQLLLPSVQIFVFCLCIAGNPYDLPLAITNMENSSYGGGSMLQHTLSNWTINQIIYSNISLALQSVRQGETWGALQISEHFTSSLKARYKGGDISNETAEGSSVQFYPDMTNVYITFTLYVTLLKDFQKFLSSFLGKLNKNPLAATFPVVLEPPIYGKIDSSVREFMAPGIVLSAINVVAMGLTCIVVLIEKKQGLLDRIQVVGVSSIEMAMSMMCTLFLVMLAQIALALIFTFVIFDLPFEGPFIWIVICIILVGFSGMTFGLLIGAFFDDEICAGMAGLSSINFNFFLCGLVWPVESMPLYLRYFSSCLPMTEVTNSFRYILSRGWTISDYYVWHGFLINAGWALLFLAAALVIFKIRRS